MGKLRWSRTLPPRLSSRLKTETTQRAARIAAAAKPRILALLGSGAMSDISPLLRAKRKCRQTKLTSAFDPTRTSRSIRRSNSSYSVATNRRAASAFCLRRESRAFLRRPYKVEPSSISNSYAPARTLAWRHRLKFSSEESQRKDDCASDLSRQCSAFCYRPELPARSLDDVRRSALYWNKSTQPTFASH